MSDMLGAMIFALLVVTVGPAILLRACRPGPVPRQRPFDITYPIGPTR